MKALWILGTVVLVTIGVPALGYLIRSILHRPLSSEQVERDKLLEESRRNARYFWR